MQWLTLYFKKRALTRSFVWEYGMSVAGRDPALWIRILSVKINSANKIAENPNLIWKPRPSPSGVLSSGVIPESEWVIHFPEQLEFPVSNAEVEFDKEIESILQTKLKTGRVAVSSGMIKDIVRKVKKKYRLDTMGFFCDIWNRVLPCYLSI